MKRCLVILLAALLLMPGIPPARSASTLQSAPVIAVADNSLTIDGQFVAIPAIFQYEILLLRENESGLQVAQFTTAQLNAFRVVIDPGNVRLPCFRNNVQMKPSAGDTLYVRRMGSDKQPATEWGMARIDAKSLSIKNAQSDSDLPTITATDSEARFTLPDEYTSYEYAIAEPGGSDSSLAWTAIGNATDNGSSTVAVKLRPRGTPYEIRARVKGDDQSGLYSSAGGVTTTKPKVYLSFEIAGPFCGGDNGREFRISYDGGNKYTSISAPAGSDRYVDLSKVFGKKDVEIVIVEVLRPAAAADGEDGDATAAAAAPVEKEIFRMAYTPRAVLSNDVKIQPISQVSGNFTFTGLPAGQKAQYMIEGQTADYTNLNLDVGLPLLTMAAQSSGRKPAKLMLRVPANDAARTPASAPKKFTQPKQPKAPSIKPDYKKEQLKVKAGLFYAIADEGVLPEQATFQEASDLLDIADAITFGKVIYVYQGETDKKPRSAVQTIRLAPRLIKPDSGEGLLLDAKGKLRLDKGFEAYGTAEKWGNLKKGETKILVRRKTNAKFNSKAGTTTGNAASLSAGAEITYSEDGKTVTGFKMDAKAPVPVESLNAVAYSNLVLSYLPANGVMDPAVFDYRFAQLIMVDAYYYTQESSFALSVAPKKDANGVSYAQEIAVKQGDREIERNDNGYYVCDRSRLGDVITLTLTPVDRNTYRETVYTFTIVEPLRSRPSYAVFSQGAGEKGILNVGMPSSILYGDSLTLTAVLVKRDITGTREISRKTTTFEYDPVDQWKNNYFTFDFRDEITGADRGAYQATVYAEAAPGVYSQSESCESGDLIVNSNELKLSIVRLAVPDSGAVRGAQISVSAAVNALGSTVASPAYQWVRSAFSIIGEYNPGTPIEGATAASYTLTDADVGFYVGVRVSAPSGLAYATVGWIERAVTVTPVSGEMSIKNTQPVVLQFKYDGLADGHTPALTAASNCVSVSVSATQTPAANSTGPVISLGTPEIVPADKLIKIPVTALGDGTADVYVTLVVGSDMYGYRKTPQSTATLRITADVP